MGLVAFDTETARFRPGVQAPELVCVSTDWGQGQELFHQKEAYGVVRLLLADGNPVVGHNVAYDMAVLGAKWPDLLPLIFQAYDEDRVTDTKIREQLINLAKGELVSRPIGEGKSVRVGYTLADLTRKYLGEQLDKDTWRMVYSQFMDVPLEEWPEGAKHYAKEDARVPRLIYRAQRNNDENWLRDEYRQARAAFWLQLLHCWGLRTDKEGVDRLAFETKQSIEEIRQALVDAKLLRENGVRDTKVAQALMVEVMGENVPLTKKTKKSPGGRVSLSEESCLTSGHPLLKMYSEFSSLQKVLSNDVEMLRKGVEFPVHPSFEFTNTGRTRAYKPNTQNVRVLPGIRECFVPRPGHCFISADYDSLELFTWSQVCINYLGFSTMAEVLNAGGDPHSEVASLILGITLEEAMRRKEDTGDTPFYLARQTGKAGNFGLPGGMGMRTFRASAKANYKIELTEAQTYGLMNAWKKRWKEAQIYFNYINKNAHTCTTESLFTGRVKHTEFYTELCNTPFQALGADCAKNAGWLIARACYIDRQNPLFGSRIVNFVHDEFQLECKLDDYVHERATELGRLMVLGAKKYLPDMKPRAKPMAAMYWSKKAETVLDAAGRIIPWAA